MDTSATKKIHLLLKFATYDSILAKMQITINSEAVIKKYFILISVMKIVIKLVKTIKELPKDKLHKKANLVEKYDDEDPNKIKTQ